VIGSALGSLVVAWQTLRTHKLRTFLTCLSLAIAVLALVMVDAASQVAADALVAQARLTQGLPETWQLDVQAGRINQDRARQAYALTTTIEAPLGGSTVLLARVNGEINGTPVAVTAVLGDLRSIRPFPITSGRWLTQGGVPNIDAEVVLSGGFAGISNGDRVHVAIPGLQTTIPARVVGSVDDRAPGATIYVRLDEILLWTDCSSSAWNQALLLHEPSERGGEAGRVLDYVASIAKLPGPPTRIDALGYTADTLATTRTIFLLIAGVSMLVGVLGILNIGLVSLRERVEEIALRRATGATRLQIGLSVVGESVLAALASAVFAVVVAWFTVPFAATSLFPNLPMIESVGFPYQTAAVGILVSGLAGFLGGIIPAIRAATIDIASIMRA